MDFPSTSHKSVCLCSFTFGDFSLPLIKKSFSKFMLEFGFIFFFF